MEKVVVSIGGSVLVSGDDDSQYIKSLADTLSELSSHYRLLVVTGGGRIARYYIETGRKLGADERFLDNLGIEITMLNASLLIAAVGTKACPLPPLSYDDAAEASTRYPIVVMGGVETGQTTDSVAAKLARRVEAHRLVNATSVDGVYTADPKKEKGARRIERMSHEDLVRISGEPTGMAGATSVFDPLAARIVASTKMPVFVVNGRDLRALRSAIMGKEFTGTRIE